MVNSPLVLVDVPNLAWRNYHALGGVSSYKLPTVYGMLRDLGIITKNVMSNRFVFCFDGNKPIRKDVYPEYKANRVKNTEDRKKVWEELTILQDDVLPAIGYENVFNIPKFEADDLIGLICKQEVDESIIIVSNDSDLYQLLEHPRVQIWNHAAKKFITEKSLFESHTMRPDQWVLYKAVIGDSSDNIKGVPGVGMIRGLMYIQAKLPPNSKAIKTIHDCNDIVEMGKKLNTVPYPDLPVLKFSFWENQITNDSWNAACSKFDVDQLIGRRP